MIGNYKAALKEEENTGAEVNEDVRLMENKIVQVMPRYLPSPFNELMSTEKIKTMEEFQRFLTTHGEVNYELNQSTRGASCMANKPDDHNDKEVAIIELLQERMKAIDVAVANAQRESERKLTALNERISKWDERFESERANFSQNMRPQRSNNIYNNYAPHPYRGNDNYNGNNYGNNRGYYNQNNYRNQNTSNYQNRNEYQGNNGQQNYQQNDGSICLCQQWQ